MPDFRQDRFLEHAEAALSTHRLRLGFRERMSDTREMLLGRHLRNMALSEALYPVLQTVELALRNSIDGSVDAAFPQSTYGSLWLSATSPVLARRDRAEVANAEAWLGSKHKEPTHHRIVAGLSLGFWTGLFTRKYEISESSSYVPTPGVQTALWPRLLGDVFPHLTRRFRTREHVYGMLAPLAELRNAVFHHRPIWDEKLNTLHVSATEAIGWISPELKAVTMDVDRFPTVHLRSEAYYRSRLRELMEK